MFSKDKSQKQVSQFMGKPTQVEMSRAAPTTMCFLCSGSQSTSYWNSKSKSLQRGKIQVIRSNRHCSYTALAQVTMVRIKGTKE